MKSKMIEKAISTRSRLMPPLTTILVIAFPALALAAGSTPGEPLSLLAKIFIAVFVAIVVFQLLPAIVLFTSLLISVFKRTDREPVVEDGNVAETGSAE